MPIPADMERIVRQLASADEEIRLEGLRGLAQGAAEGALDLVFRAFGDPSWRVRKEAADLFLQLPVSRELAGEIIELLHAEENAGLRNTAVDLLVRMGRDAVPLLLDQITCADHDVRKFIIDILGEIADPRAILPLLAALEDKDGNVRAAAAENLGKLRAAAAVPALLEAMRHPDLLLRFTILEALGNIGVPVALRQLLPFRDEKLLRKALIDCLGTVGDDSAFDELLAGVTDPMRNVREASLLGLVALAARYPETVREKLARHDLPATGEEVAGYLAADHAPPLRLAAVQLLGWLGSSRGVRPLLELLEEEALQAPVFAALVEIGRRQPQALLDAWPQSAGLQRASLAYVIGAAGCRAGVNLLRTGLADADPSLARMCAHSLGLLGGEADLPLLAEGLRHADADVRDAARGALVALGAEFPEATLTALESVLTDSAPARRSAAVSVLGGLAAESVANRLVMALKDPAAEVRRASLQALGAIGPATHLHAVQLALTDEDVEVRRIAVQLLGTIPDSEALGGLRLALRDEDLWVRAAAVRGLGRLGGGSEAETIRLFAADPVGLVSIAALETLADLLGEQACPHFSAALDHPDEEVVNVALDLLSRHGAGSWLAVNAETLINHSAWNVRAHCARLLVVLLGSQAKPVLERRISVEGDELVRQQLLGALAELDS